LTDKTYPIDCLLLIALECEQDEQVTVSAQSGSVVWARPASSNGFQSRLGIKFVDAHVTENRLTPV